MQNLKKYFYKKKVLITGHTGFKGSWLTQWLLKFEANITGISLSGNKNQFHFNYLKIRRKINHIKADIRDFNKIKKIINKIKPDFIFHLAAQALVKESYKNPKFTFETNTFGTLNILESLRKTRKNCSVVLITSDKVYKNYEITNGYSEKDELGGYDPYSGSKAAAEMVIHSYLKSILNKNKLVKVAIARAGNVLGGGDWAEDRLIPDCVKSWSKKKIALIRSPNSIRPWQHVLEVVHGYLKLAIHLKRKKIPSGEAFNFGPNKNNVKNVYALIHLMKKNWKKVKIKVEKKRDKNFNETKILKLNSNKSKKLLNWKCILTFKETIKMITDWYKSFYLDKNNNKKNITLIQISEFEKKLKERI